VYHVLFDQLLQYRRNMQFTMLQFARINHGEIIYAVKSIFLVRSA